MLTPRATASQRHRRRGLVLLTALLLALTTFAPGQAATATPEPHTPPPPKPEQVKVEDLPLPPTAPSDDEGSCTQKVNPRGTGCIDGDWQALQGGGFTPDGRHATATVDFSGAPKAPDPASVYKGEQLILVKTDGSRFPNGDPWKCLTCGTDAGSEKPPGSFQNYPQPFADGRRVLLGNSVVSCGRHRLTSRSCTPERIRSYPIRWNVKADGSGEGGTIRELRLHPDNEHIGFSSTSVTGGRLDQYSYFARLKFNPAPKTGSPRTPRYDLVKVSRLFDSATDQQPVRTDKDHPDRLVFDPDVPSVGELRGFTEDGREVIYIGHPHESSNIDAFAADLTTGKVRRLTAHPEYTDPVDSSPDDKWTVALDTRGSDRQMFLAAMRDVPPITDLLTTSAVSSVRNNHQRRFFQPYLIDRYGDRGDYAGQQLNGGDTGPGGVGDPNWNAGADPQWSPDGTSVMYWQRLVSAPACGGANPLPCPESTEPGGRRTRLMLAHLPEREPVRKQHVPPVSDEVPWGTPYKAGSPAPVRPYPAEGTYTLRGKASGKATVDITWDAAKENVRTVRLRYDRYSDDGKSVLNGTERVTRTNPSETESHLDWYSDLVQNSPSGDVQATKKTSPDGFHLTIDLHETVFHATGTLTTKVGDRTYTQPANGT